jgi:hypothetical protein
VNEDQAPRRNRDGHPCPPWCVTDHGTFSFHGAERISVQTAEYRTYRVRAIQYATHGGPNIQVAGNGMVTIPSDNAEDLAAIIEELAGATPEEHHQLAAAIRRAAAQITAAGGAQ